MAAPNRPLQGLIHSAGQPGARSSSQLVTAELQALADPPAHTVDSRVLNALIAEARTPLYAATSLDN